jgi:hypothetical protein
LVLLDSLDQFLRMKENAYTIFMDSIHQIDQTNAAVLKDIIAQYGYPGEKLIGVCDSLSPGKPGDFVLIHQTFFGLPYPSPIDFSSLIHEAVKGNIPAHTVAHLMDAKQQAIFADHLTIGLFKAVVSDSVIMNTQPLSSLEKKEQDAEFVYPDRQGEFLRSFDERRKHLGLESSEQFREKTYYGINNKKFFFQYTGGVSVFHFISPKERDSFVRNFKIYKAGVGINGTNNSTR